MQNNLGTYLLYTIAIINVLIVIKTFELSYRFDDYIRQDKEIKAFQQKPPQRDKAINIFILITALFAITIPIKLQLFKISNADFYIQLGQQLFILFLAARLNAASTKLLIASACLKFFKAFYAFEDECIRKGIEEIDAKELFKKMPIPPWHTEPTTILIIKPLLDRAYIAKLKEEMKKIQQNTEVIEYVTKQFDKKQKQK